MSETMARQFSEVELRIKELTIHIPEKKDFLQRVIEGKTSEVKLFSVISDGVPDNTLHTDLGIFPVDSKNRSIKFGPYGYSLYRNKAGQIPRYLDCHITVVEDDSDIRSMAQLMSKIRRSDNFRELTKLLLEASLNPALLIGMDVAKEILGIGLSILKQNGDDLLMRQYFSFNYRIDGYHEKFQLDSPEAKVSLEVITA